METRNLKRKSFIGIVSGTSNLNLLYDDLLIEIFLRCSVQSLICAKYVCKKWYTLINNSVFELNIIQYQKIHNKGRLLLQYFKEETKRYIYALFDDETLVKETYQDLDSFRLNPFELHIEGPIDGLYCLFINNDRVIVCNPALSEFRTLPLPHPHFSSHVVVGKIGFGIDPSIHDYKLVLIRHFLDGTSSEKHPSVYVTMCNLSKNTWRLLDIGDFRLCEQHNYLAHTSSFLKENYYWWDDCGFVIAFDMGKEDFRQILGPKFSGIKPYHGNLTLYNDKVALMLPRDAFLDIWVMLEEGVWIKQFSFTHFPSNFSVVGIWKNDLVLSTNNSSASKPDLNSQIFLLNMNTQKMRNIMGPRGTVYCFRSSVYYESLVSVGFVTKHKGKRTSLSTLSDFLNSSSNPYIDT